jgi:hypothetical protein
MRRFFSHYSFIFPDTYLKNYILEIDGNDRISDCFPFEREIENTSFYSGLLLYVPEGVAVNKDYIEGIKNKIDRHLINWSASPDVDVLNRAVHIYTEDEIRL